MKKLYCVVVYALLICLLPACAKKTAESGSTSEKEETAQVQETEVQEDTDQEPPEQEAAETGEEELSDEQEAEMAEELRQADAKFCGIWECGRATLKVVRVDAGYKCYITWGGSAFDRACWDYDCYYDGTNLVSFETGTKKIQTFGQDGEMTGEETVFTDGAVSLGINENGKLTWKEFKEDAGADMEFDRMGTDVYIPDPQEVYEEYYLIVGAFGEGTAGSSLARAQAACSAMQFAAVHELCMLDRQSIQDGLLSAWDEMTEDERSRFDANFMSIVHLLDDCIEDFEANRGVFEDAGVARQMEVLLSDPMDVLSWKTLRDNTLTLGNSDGN